MTDRVTLDAQMPGTPETDMVNTLANGIVHSCTSVGLDSNQIISVAGQIFNIAHGYSMDQFGQSDVPTALRMLADYLEKEALDTKKRVN